MSTNAKERRLRGGVARSVAVIGVVVMALAVASAVGASGARVTRGAVHAFATGSGLDISGDARMVRTADRKTIVIIHVVGLAPNTAYGSHVHQQACANGEADGHYKFDPAGPATPPNEIWPAFTTNASGIGNGYVSVDGTAGPTAMAVVVHAPGGAKIACADLD